MVAIVNNSQFSIFSFSRHFDIAIVCVTPPLAVALNNSIIEFSLINWVIENLLEIEN